MFEPREKRRTTYSAKNAHVCRTASNKLASIRSGQVLVGESIIAKGAAIGSEEARSLEGAERCSRQSLQRQNQLLFVSMAQ